MWFDFIVCVYEQSRLTKPENTLNIDITRQKFSDFLVVVRFVAAAIVPYFMHNVGEFWEVLNSTTFTMRSKIQVFFFNQQNFYSTVSATADASQRNYKPNIRHAIHPFAYFIFV